MQKIAKDVDFFWYIYIDRGIYIGIIIINFFFNFVSQSNQIEGLCFIFALEFAVFG
jgi:hypothetical protein